MRRFEHPDGRFWAVGVSLAKTVEVKWGAKGTTGQQRTVEAAKPTDKVQELIERQLALGFVETQSFEVIVDEIREDARWYRKFVLNADRSFAVAIEGKKVFEWRDGDEEPRVHRERSFEKAKARVREGVENAFGQGMTLTDEVEVIPAAAAWKATRSNPQLEVQCRAAPDDAGVWTVYADWLIAQNDPRGELAALHARGLAAEAAARFDEIRLALFGDPEHRVLEAVTFTAWRHGFPIAATIRVDEEADLAKTTARFLKLPVAVFIEALQFGLPGIAGETNWGPTLRAVTSAPHAAWMRSLRFDHYDEEDQEISWVKYGDFSKAWAKLPALVELQIRAGAGGKLGAIELPALERFVRITGGLGATELDSIAKARWPALQHLEIWFGRADYGCDATIDQLAPIFSARDLPALRHLGIVNCEDILDAICELLEAPLLPQLRSLDLSRGVIAAEACEALIEGEAKLRHLETIDVSENLLEDDELARLKRALPNVVSTVQRYGGYVAVGE